MSKKLEITIERKDFVVGKKRLPILGDIQLQVEAGEFVSVLGPSGCGKTTLLRLILGLDLNYQGEIKLGDQLITGPGLDRGVVFQTPRLMPWLSVRENIEFAIPDGRSSKAARNHVQQLIELVGLVGFEKAWPKQLSGGMSQRVALARAFINLPDLLVLDEPFGALDTLTRMTMQEELLRILDKEDTTAFMVTHDVDEAIFVSDKIIVMSARPALTKAVFCVKLDKPRNRTNNDFLKLRANIMEEFYA